MKEGYEYSDCAIAYNEENFVDLVTTLTEESAWYQRSEAARSLGAKISWQNTLQPLCTILEDGAKKCR
jgi:HEAT repeat protein